MNDLITLEPDPAIEPGHQWLILPTTSDGNALARLLSGKSDVYEFAALDGENVGETALVLRIPHSVEVDRNILLLINLLAHVRFSAPDLVQLSLIESPAELQGGQG